MDDDEALSQKSHELPLALSVVLITLNEERRLPACLASLPAGCELIVVDSYSSDRTCALAREAGAKVYQHAFHDYASQKNLALTYASRTWVLSLDADEVLSPSLRAELVAVCQTTETAPPYQAYRLRRALVFMGRPLRFGKSRDRPLRLCRRGEALFKHAIH